LTKIIPGYNIVVTVSFTLGKIAEGDREAKK